MIEYQKRFPEFPGEPWQKILGSDWQMISLSDIKQFRFRFHGKLIEKRRYLCAYLEKEIIHAKLLGHPIKDRLRNGGYKK